MVKKVEKPGVTNEKIMEVLLIMDERVTNMDERITDMNERMATKDDLERLKDEIIEPIIRAVDKDAETVFDHGGRIAVLERRAGIATK